MKRVVTAMVIMLALAACGSTPRDESTQGDESTATGGTGRPFNWDVPQPEGAYIDVSDVSSIESSLAFTPLEPRLGGLLHINATDPAHNLPDGMLLFFFYQDPTYGRIVVKEQLNRTTQSALEGMLVYNDEPTSDGVFALVKLGDGTEALVVTQKTASKDGLAPNAVEFLVGSADVTVFGPDGTFTSDLAVPVANLVLPAK